MLDFKCILKKFGKNVLFIGILIAILAGISYPVEKAMIANDHMVQNRNKSMFRILREPKDSIDVIVVGDSLSYSAISPMEMWKDYGITTYVCGQSGQKIQETYRMIETAFKTQSPKVVLLETNVLFRGNTSVIGWKESFENWGGRSFPIFQGHDLWKTIVMKKTYPSENYKGFTFRCGIQPYEKGDYMIETDEKVAMPTMVVNYMEKIQELCKAHNAELVLVGTPSPKNYNYKKHNMLKEYSREKSLTFIDLNLKLEDVGIEWKTDSLDQGDHLNLSGAVKVSQYLGRYLKEQFDLTDHRQEKRYIDWRKEVEIYQKKASQYLNVIRKGT